jgi:thioester reductase-like protein
MKGLENTDMEDIMNASSTRQAQAVCNFAYPFNDLKRTNVLGTEFAARSRLQGPRVVI